ncbi:hypothetical protein C0Q70_03643 [Pomacea canaliculata]|uniref:Uncharacterized protein n=1 Tax=Pomacea canaliculata TaxID=400727 RepID=A0A2T7PTE4_POMCA|nr:hypothetical protein C0Q70_03643 [Pomacea canaliculata]
MQRYADVAVAALSSCSSSTGERENVTAVGSTVAPHTRNRIPACRLQHVATTRSKSQEHANLTQTCRLPAALYSRPCTPLPNFPPHRLPPSPLVSKNMRVDRTRLYRLIAEGSDRSPRLTSRYRRCSCVFSKLSVEAGYSHVFTVAQ